MTKLNTAKLYAMLMVDEYFRRVNADWAIVNSIVQGVERPASSSYCTFLHKQRQHGNAYCPYNRAVRMIEGRAS